METSYRTSQTSKLEPYTAKVISLWPKSILAKSSTLYVRKDPK